MTSQIRLKAAAQAKADATLKTVVPTAKALGKVVCPKCNKSVSARGLNQPCGTMLHA